MGLLHDWPIEDTKIKNNVSTYIINLNTMVLITGSTNINGQVTVNIKQYIMGLLTGLLETQE